MLLDLLQVDFAYDGPCRNLRLRLLVILASKFAFYSWKIWPTGGRLKNKISETSFYLAAIFFAFGDVVSSIEIHHF